VPTRVPESQPQLLRAVSRWQIVALSINDVVGSGVYLLPAAAAALLGPASVWAIALAGVLVGLLVLCYAQASSYFDEAGGAYVYTREAFGPFVGFEVGWMTWLTRIATAAALSNGFADALVPIWPGAASGAGHIGAVILCLVTVTAINVVGIRAGARTAVALVFGKMLPLLFFIAVGVFYVDWSRVPVSGWPQSDGLAQGALLLLFAYAGFENTPASAGEYKNPQRNVPFALLTMILVVTVTYVAIQVVAQGTLAGIAGSKAPLADAARGFGGAGAAWLMTIGGAISILGTLHNTTLAGPRYVYAITAGGIGPAALSSVHPRFRTPTVAILTQSAIGLLLALSGSFVQLVLLSVMSRLITYTGTAASLLVLRRKFADRPGALKLPGGDAIPIAALVVALVLVASASWKNLVAGAAALIVGALIYRFWRRSV
jgi:basic amino acid/polyamine antiporter, APA family